MDFAGLPPEINSARMYAGAGSGPLLAAASAWSALAAELRSAALSYGTTISALADDEWRGSSSAAMADAAAPYVGWLNATAGQAEEAAAQASAAAAAYETAFTETVPPPVIAANRAQLRTLIAGNTLGVNTAAIAATEAQYGEMWAQDAAAMYRYAATSAVATQLTQFAEPQHTASADALTAQSAAVTQAAAESGGTQPTTLSRFLSALPAALQGMAVPSSSSSSSSGMSGIVGLLTGSGSGSAALDNFWNVWGPNATIWNTVFASGFYAPSNTLGPFMSFLSGAAVANTVGDQLGDAASGGLGGVVTGPLGGVGGPGRLGDAISAGLGNSARLGALSVPPSWTAAPPLHSPLSATLGGTPMIAPAPSVAAGTPPVPLGGMGGQVAGRSIPQYGFRPTFVARPPAAG